ncbi:MAG: TPM domain-containing protein [Minisyncoccia bacterium]|jgi:uncharacterized protein
MKTIGRSILNVLSFVVAIAATHAAEYPKPTGYVNDFARLLSHDTAGSLNQELIVFEKKTTIEIAVVTVSSLNGESIENYTRELANAWGVGKRGQNNGVVFLIAPNERKMRIETASGARLILTDSQADAIRDETVLPRFKAGDMPGGIIDGTHAIMRALDAASSAAAEAIPISQSENLYQWTAEDTKILEYGTGGIVGAIVLSFLIVPPIWRSKARKYVLKNKAGLAEQLTEAEKTAANPDVKAGTRKKLAELKENFSPIYRLTINDRHVDWVEAREKLDSLGYPLSDIVVTMKDEIAFAEKARREGPKLMKKIPSMIEAAQKKLAEGKPSKEAVRHLEEARAQYAQAQGRSSEMTVTDWVILYLILTNAQSSCASAESAHEYANTDHPRSSDSSFSSSSSSGFGDAGGFGGGGFGIGGGGTTGGW